MKGGEGVKLENTCAVCLLKHVRYLHDVNGRDTDLHYIKTKDGKEIDFVISENGSPTELIEVRLADSTLSKSLVSIAGHFPDARPVQLVHNLRQEEDIRGVRVTYAAQWLAGLSV